MFDILAQCDVPGRGGVPAAPVRAVLDQTGVPMSVFWSRLYRRRLVRRREMQILIIEAEIGER